MKKILLLISFVLLSVSTAFAVEGLNPYAYNLSWRQTNENRTLQVSYCLNAPAKSVTLDILNEAGTQVLASFTNLPVGETEYNKDNNPQITPHVYEINMAELISRELPMGSALSWRITVTGTSPGEPTMITAKTFNFYCPQGIAVDKNPSSPNFGKVFVTETLDGKSIASKNYYSKNPYGADKNGKIVAGVYVFSPNFTKITPNSTPYNGGNTFTQQMAPFKDGTGATFDGGHQPFQICVSEDSRIFVSSGDKRTDGVVVWEIDKDDFNKWTPIIKGTWDANWQLVDANNTVFSGFNTSMAVNGSGENLTLLLYTTTKASIEGMKSNGYRLFEYKIGTNTGQFTGSPTEILAFRDKYGTVYDKANVIYDGDGGYWFGASRATEKVKEPNLVHVNKDGVETYNSCAYDFFGGAGLLVYTPSKYPTKKWLIKGVNNGATGTTYGKFSIWEIGYNSSTKKTTLTGKYTNIQSTGLKRYHNAFAMDYAENLFVVGNLGEKCLAFALPYSGTKTTPAPQKMTLTAPNQNITYNVTLKLSSDSYFNGEPMGVLTGGGAKLFGDQVTVTATPSDSRRFEFVKWVASPSNNVYTTPKHTFTITGDVTITAFFKEKVYKVEYFNLFKGYQDITDYYKGENATMDNNTNSRLWRLFQVAYNQNYSDHYDCGYATLLKKSCYAVMYFVHTHSRSNQDEERSTICSNVEQFVDNDTYSNNLNNYSFNWLGKYIEHVVGTEVDYETRSEGWYNVWGFYLQAFFNRTNIYNASLNAESSITSNYPKKDFTILGRPDYWRKWWQQIDCGLDTICTYETSMPIEWKRRISPTQSIRERTRKVAANGNISYTNTDNYLSPGNWYQWNYYDDKLLGWCYGSKDPSKWENEIATEKIVHNVYKDGNLLAVWLDKKLHEAKNNYDVTKLLKTNINNAHAVSVYRPLQAGMYNTICLPFSLSTLVGTPYEGATVLKLNTAEVIEAEGNYDVETEQTLNIYFTQVTFQNGDIMEAGVPYLIQPLNDIPNEVTFTVSSSDMYDIPESGLGEVVYDIVEEGQSPNIAFHGVISPTHLPNSPHTLILVADNRLAVPEIVVDDSEDENVAVLTGDQMLGLRGYFTLQGAAAAQSLAQQSAMHIGKKVTTDTPEVPEEEEEVEITQPATPKTSKIMYQGNIYILRGNEVYTLTGHRVK